MRFAVLISFGIVMATVLGVGSVGDQTPAADDAAMSVVVQPFVYEVFMRIAGDGCGVDLEKDEAFLVTHPFLLLPSDYVRRPIFDNGSIVDAADSSAGEAGCLIEA